MTIVAFYLQPVKSGDATLSKSWSHYLHSFRWLGHIYIGSIGAVVNVEIVNFRLNLLLLLSAGLFCLHDCYKYDYSIVIYLMKTFAGDFLAGKLDTTEWKLALFFVFGILAPAVSLLAPDIALLSQDYSRILIILFLFQLFCEYGDNHMEHWKFFRHRYSFEVCNLLLVLLMPLRQHELDVVRYDLVICMFYRISNFTILLGLHAYSSRIFLNLAFALHSFLIGVPVVCVTDPDLAILVLKESNRKGEALEKYSSTPAWRPIISLESVDGELWEGMSSRFHHMLQILPPVKSLIDIAAKHCEEAKRDCAVIEANTLARLTIKCFIEYVLNCEWKSEFELFVEASWEWRKEIAIKGKADVLVKEKAVNLFLRLLEETNDRNGLWRLYGEQWRDPEYYSMILQPFIISPCINTGRICFAFLFAYHGLLCCLSTPV